MVKYCTAGAVNYSVHHCRWLFAEGPSLRIHLLFYSSATVALLPTKIRHLVDTLIKTAALLTVTTRWRILLEHTLVNGTVNIIRKCNSVATSRVEKFFVISIPRNIPIPRFSTVYHSFSFSLFKPFSPYILLNLPQTCFLRIFALSSSINLKMFFFIATEIFGSVYNLSLLFKIIRCHCHAG